MIKNNEVKPGSTSKNIDKAAKKLEIMNMTDEEKAHYEQYLINVVRERDRLETAKTEGEIKEKVKIATIMIQEGESNEKIKRYTGLTDNEIAAIRNWYANKPVTAVVIPTSSIIDTSEVEKVIAEEATIEDNNLIGFKSIFDSFVASWRLSVKASFKSMFDVGSHEFIDKLLAGKLNEFSTNTEDLLDNLNVLSTRKIPAKTPNAKELGDVLRKFKGLVFKYKQEYESITSDELELAIAATKLSILELTNKEKFEEYKNELDSKCVV